MIYASINAVVIYVRLLPLPPRSLMCLSSLSVVEEMSELFRNDLLPSADEVAALCLQFATPPMVDSNDINPSSEL